MGMGAQNRGATGVPAPTQMAMQGGAAPQGLMALMQQRGKGAGMPGGMPQGGPGMGKPDPRMFAAMQAFQQQGAQGSMPGAPGKGAGLPPPRTQEEMQRAMDKMQFASEMRGNIDPRTGAPVGALVSQPAPGKGGGMPPRPGVPSTMVNPARPQVMPRPTPRPQPARPKGFDGFR